MKIIDLSHLMIVHTPGWVGYAGNKRYYAQNRQTKQIVAQRIDTALNVGTHIVTIDEAIIIHWNNREWTSLSAVTRAITGGHWSGPALFGLRPRPA